MSFYEYKVTFEVTLTTWGDRKLDLPFNKINELIDEIPDVLRGSSSMKTECLGMLVTEAK